MLESAAADEASFTVAPDTADDTAAASSLEKGQVSSTGNGSLATSLAGAMASFKESAKRGDSVSFAVLVAEICSGPSGVDLPLCDGCMEDTLRWVSSGTVVDCTPPLKNVDQLPRFAPRSFALILHI